MAMPRVGIGVRVLLPLSVLLVWVAMVVLSPWLPLHPDAVDLPHILLGPWQAFGTTAGSHDYGLSALLGFDDLGRPIFDRLVSGAQTSLLVAVSVVTVSASVGSIIGVLSAWLGGFWDHLLVRIIDIFLAFPGILLAIALAGLLGPGIDNVVFALAIVGWVGFARLARAQTLSVKQREHVSAALALGTSSTRIIGRHLLPLVAAPLIVEATFGFAGAVIAEAGLSFLGLGVQPPDASWGSMIRDGSRYMLIAPHMVLAPGLALAMVVLAINLLGDRLRDHLDVQLKPGR